MECQQGKTRIKSLMQVKGEKSALEEKVFLPHSLTFILIIPHVDMKKDSKKNCIVFALHFFNYFLLIIFKVGPGGASKQPPSVRVGT